MVRPALRFSALFLSSATLFLAGCSITHQSSTALIPSGRQGVVHGGQQPVTGATIQLYAVGTTGDGSAATALLSPAPTTDANGGFTLTGTYTCPSPTALVYLVATGGNPGSSANNPNLAMMAALGPCGNLSASTFIVVNELTTVGAVYALAPFMLSPSAIGSATGDAAALSTAFTLAAELVDTSSGTAPGTGVPAGTTVPVMQINLLGDILAACVNSPGGVAGDTSSCGNLFALTTPTTTPATPPATDTISALLNLANNPTLNTQALFSLTSPTAPFQPTPSLTPPSLAVTPTVPSGFSVSPSSLSSGSLTTGFTSTSQTVTLTNNDANPVVLNSISVIGTNPSDFVLSNACSTPLYASQSCTVSVQFQAQAAGARNAYLEVNTNAENPLIDVALAGTGVAPAAGVATLSPTSLSFSLFGVSQNVTLTNSGSSTLTINGINFGASTAFTQTNNCGTSLPAMSICTIAVSALAKPDSSAVMTVVDDAAAGPQTITVAYTGPVGGVSGANFGAWAIGAQTTSSVTLIANGTADVSQTSGVLSGPNASDFAIQDSNSFPVTYVSSGPIICPVRTIICDFVIRFIPSGLGLRTATLTTSFGVVTLTGTGEPAGVDFSLALTNGTLFPTTINTPSSEYVTISNTGTVPVTLNAPVITGPNAAQFSASGVCGTLAVAATCTLTVTDTPTQLGPISGTLTLTDSTATVVRTLALAAAGQAPAPAANPNSLTFFTQMGSVSAPQMVTITAYHNDPVMIAWYAGTTSFFQFSTSYCPQTPCQVSVTFAPTAASGYGGYLEMTDTVYGGGSSISLTGTGLNGVPAVNLSPNPLTFPLRSVGSTSIAQTVTLTNSGTGTAALNISGISLVGTNPGDFILTNSCGASLAAGASCTFTVSFSPTATGTRSAAVQILSNASTSPDMVPLSGTAEGPEAFSGAVYGGQLPISGAHVYLFAANTTGYGQASTSLLNAASTGFSDSVGAYVMTGTDGSFLWTGDYTCAPGSQVYAYALGGNPGSGTNSASGLMAALGSCPGTGNFAALSPVAINEVTTVAAAYALAGFATDAIHVSSSATTLAQTGIANAFANAASLANPSTGAALATTSAGNGTVPQNEINTLANILAACVESTGPSSGSCSSLFTNAESGGSSGSMPSDTATAAINIAHNPSANLANLYTLSLTSTAFTPILPAQPNDFTVGVSFTAGTMTGSTFIAIDGLGDAWVLGGTVDRSVVKLSSTGAVLATASGAVGSGCVGCIADPTGIAIDTSGNAWISDGLSQVTEVSSSGVIALPNYHDSSDETVCYAIALDGNGSVWLPNLNEDYGPYPPISKDTVVELNSFGVPISPRSPAGNGYVNGGILSPQAVAVDSSGNAWVSNQGGTVTEISSSGTFLSGANGFMAGTFGTPQGIAIDSSGNAWVANLSNISFSAPSALTELSSTGASLSGSVGYTGGGLNTPFGVAIDGAGNVWVGNTKGNSLSEFSNSGVAISPSTGYTGGGQNLSRGVAIDGSGNVWTTNKNGVGATELIGAATPVVTPLSIGVKNNQLGTRP